MRRSGIAPCQAAILPAGQRREHRWSRTSRGCWAACAFEDRVSCREFDSGAAQAVLETADIAARRRSTRLRTSQATDCQILSGNRHSFPPGDGGCDPINDSGLRGPITASRSSIPGRRHDRLQPPTRSRRWPVRAAWSRARRDVPDHSDTRMTERYTLAMCRRRWAWRRRARQTPRGRQTPERADGRK